MSGFCSRKLLHAPSGIPNMEVTCGHFRLVRYLEIAIFHTTLPSVSSTTMQLAGYHNRKLLQHKYLLDKVLAHQQQLSVRFPVVLVNNKKGLDAHLTLTYLTNTVGQVKLYIRASFDVYGQM